MSKYRQTDRPEPEHRLVVRSVGFTFPSGFRIDDHHHDWPQLVYASAGSMSVRTDAGEWIVPPQRSVWVPAGMRHSIEMIGSVQMRTLYLRPDVAALLPVECRVLNITPLVRELVLEIVRIGALDQTDDVQSRLAGVLIDQLNQSSRIDLALVMPRDPRARRLAERLRNEPSNRQSLTQLAQGTGAAARTLERLFVRETGLTFGRWRQQARLLHALRRLGEGESVTIVALESGYDSTSAFIAMFKRLLGTTPGRYWSR